MIDEGSAVQAIRNGLAVPVRTLGTQQVWLVERGGQHFAFVCNKKLDRVVRWVPLERVGAKYINGAAKRLNGRQTTAGYIPLMRPVILGWRPVPSYCKRQATLERDDIEHANLPKGGSKNQKRIRKLMLRDGAHCAYCMSPVFLAIYQKKPTATVDHVIPRSRGGSNALSNQVLACQHCNKLKGDKMPADFMREIWGENLENCPHEGVRHYLEFSRAEEAIAPTNATPPPPDQPA